MLGLVEERAQAGRAALAGQPNANQNVLDFLARWGATATRSAVAANADASLRTNQFLANDSDNRVRAELAAKLGRILPCQLKAEEAHVRDAFITMLEQIASDREASVRAALAEEIKLLDCAPKAVIDALARDAQSIVAVPILQFSPLLTDEDLLEIVAAAEASDVLAAITRRKAVSGVVSAAIVETLDTGAIAALLANRQAHIRKKTLDRIVAQAASSCELHAPLTLRPELSRRMIWRISQFVGAALLDSLAQRHGLDPVTRHVLRARLRRRLKCEAAGLTPHAPAANANGDGELVRDGDGLEQAIGAGRRETVECALARRAHIDLDVVRKIFAARAAKPLTALVWQAGLSMRFSFKIQTELLRLKGPELLPARNGEGFPLDKSEMRWQLDFFRSQPR